MDKAAAKAIGTEKKENKPARANSGVALYMAIVVMSIMFSVAFGMSAISIARIKSLNSIGNSVVAFYAADAGAERGIKESTDSTYEISHDYLDTNGNGYEDEGDATYEVHGVAAGSGDCPITLDYCLKCEGEYMGTKRKIQITFK